MILLHIYIKRRKEWIVRLQLKEILDFVLNWNYLKDIRNAILTWWNHPYENSIIYKERPCLIDKVSKYRWKFLILGNYWNNEIWLFSSSRREKREKISVLLIQMMIWNTKSLKGAGAMYIFTNNTSDDTRRQSNSMKTKAFTFKCFWREIQDSIKFEATRRVFRIFVNKQLITLKVTNNMITCYIILKTKERLSFKLSVHQLLYFIQAK